eukprot:TRINITY_DN14625_c0_g1_i1.p3 TRINITY_DN14625_c0_g1~~TRINITY_DN14625_c0_g1_i1.p3  ORF type:complete len:123 (-),score=26.20 TRINITY_DN14625_c0_g1_i1:125-493(-)
MADEDKKNNPSPMERAEKDAKAAMSKYMESELRVATESYRYLGELNIAAAGTYENVLTRARSMSSSLQEIQQAYDKFQPYLNQIDELEHSISMLEKTVARLDTYTEDMEKRFSKLHHESTSQ